jgi:hypothetical protein
VIGDPEDHIKKPESHISGSEGANASAPRPAQGPLNLSAAWASHESRSALFM